MVTESPVAPVAGVNEAKTGLPVKTKAEGILGPVDTVLALVPLAHSPEVFSPTEKAAAPLEISAEWYPPAEIDVPRVVFINRPAAVA
jgi:hypothetical protein